MPVIDPSQYKGPSLALKTSAGPVLALRLVPMYLFTMFCPVSEQMKHKFVVTINNDDLLTSASDMFQSPWE